MAGQTRLNVNINKECADALRELAAANGINVTEVVRLAISFLYLAGEINARGNQLIELDPERGRDRQITPLPSLWPDGGAQA